MKRTCLSIILIMFGILLIGQTNIRTYPAIKPYNPLAQERNNIKGQVKTYHSESETFPRYYTYCEYSVDGKMVLSSGGRINMRTQTLYWYDDKGYLIKEQMTESANGEDYPYETIIYIYDFDSQGYPITAKKLSESGVTLESQSFTYSDSTYSVDSFREPTENGLSFEYNTKSVYNSQGKISSMLKTNLTDGTTERYDYAYIPTQNTTIEWIKGSYTQKTVTRKNNQEATIEIATYDGKNKLNSKVTNTLDKHNNILQSNWFNAAENSTTCTISKYTLDKYGNPLSETSHTDGEEDETINYTYEYY